MSHYTRVKTKLSDKSCLLKALADMGFKENQLKISDTPQQLQGYQGDLREQAAEIILPRAFVGGASNDIGFKLNEDGSWGAMISDYDRGNRAAESKSPHAKDCGGYSEKWLKKLYQRYSLHKVKDQLSSQGFFIEEETEENGEINLKVNSSAFGGQ